MAASSSLYCAVCGTANRAQARYCNSCGQQLPRVEASFPHPATGCLPAGVILKQRYRILRIVGIGGMGAVYQAEDMQLGNRLVALKEMSQSGLSPSEVQEAARTFKQEALLLARLHHPNLPSIFDHFEEYGRWYLVMSFIQGETLADALQKAPGGKLALAEVLAIGKQVCTALDYLHSQQPPIIFRDLKPSNIMRSSGGHLYLIDFGIARHFKPGSAKDTAYYVSAGYSPPEQFGTAQTTPRSDIYSLGATLYHLVSGYSPARSPFRLPPLSSLLPDAPGDFIDLLNQMLALDEQQRPASARMVQQQLEALASQPDAVVYVNKGDAFRKLGRWQEALATYEEALRLDPANAVAYNSKGVALGKLGRYQEALAAFEEALRLDPANVAAYSNKGGALDGLRRYQEALAAYEQALRLDPTNAAVHYNKGRTLNELGRYQEALAAYEQALRLDPTYAAAYTNKGVALGDLGRYQEALAAFEEALRLDPTNVAAYNSKGVVLGKLGRYQEALAALEEALRLDPTNVAAYSNKGGALDGLRRYQEALAALEEALRLDPTNAAVHYNKGRTLNELGRYQEAQQAFQQARSLQSKQ